MAAERERALDVLIRLARQAQNHERSRLAAIDQRLAETDAVLATLEDRVTQELQGSAEVGSPGALLGPYLEAAKARRTALFAARTGLEQERDVQLEELTARRLELRRLEILAETRMARARADAARQEQKTLDDLVLIRTSTGTG